MPKEKEQSVSDSIDLELVRERYTPMAEAGYRFLTPSILWDKHGGQICEFSLFYPKAQEYAEAPELVLGLLALIEAGTTESDKSEKLADSYEKLLKQQEKEILELRKRVGTAEAKLKLSQKST
tara:strand:- start:155 stop:523 length:369 start_codon:yes stop_codon:yes gene_type:complete